MITHEIDGQVLELPYSDKTRAFVLAWYPHLNAWTVRSRAKSIKLAEENVLRTAKRFGNDGTKFVVVGLE